MNDQYIYFVYVRGLRRPEPQKWFGDQTKGTGQYKHGSVGDPNGTLLFMKVITPKEATLPISELEKRYSI